MNIELLRERLREYFATVKPEDLVNELKGMGYEFTSTPAAPPSVDDMAKKEQYANIEDVANSIAEDMYPYPSHMKYAFGGKGLVDADRFKIVKGFKLGAQWQKQRDADTIAQLQETNLELSKRVFELEKELDEQTLSFMDWMLLNSYEYSYTNKGWQNDFPDGMDPNSEEPTYHTTEQLLQIYKQSKVNYNFLLSPR